MENRDIMSIREQLATRKLLEDIEHALTLSTSFSVKLNIERLMKDHRKEWSK